MAVRRWRKDAPYMVTWGVITHDDGEIYVCQPNTQEKAEAEATLYSNSGAHVVEIRHYDVGRGLGVE